MSKEAFMEYVKDRQQKKLEAKMKAEREADLVAIRRANMCIKRNEYYKLKH